MRTLTIAWLQEADYVKPIRLTAQQKLHQLAIASLAATKIHDREAARRKFAPQRAELERLKERLNNLS